MIKALIRQKFVRFATVGIISNTLLYLAYLHLTLTLEVEHKTAMTVVYIAAVMLTFIANRTWSFRHNGIALTAFVRYVLAYVMGYVLNLALLWLAVDLLKLPHEIVQATAIVIVAIFMFFLNKYWVFAQSLRSNAA